MIQQERTETPYEQHQLRHNQYQQLVNPRSADRFQGNVDRFQAISVDLQGVLDQDNHS